MFMTIKKLCVKQLGAWLVMFLPKFMQQHRLNMIKERCYYWFW